MSEPVLWLHVDRLVPFVNADQLVFYVEIVWRILILELVEVVKNVLDLLNILGLVPEQAFWVL